MFGPSIFSSSTNISLIPALDNLLFGYEVKNVPVNLGVADRITGRLAEIYNIKGNGLYTARPSNTVEFVAQYVTVNQTPVQGSFNNGKVIRISNVCAYEGVTVDGSVTGLTGMSFFCVGDVQLTGNDPVFIAVSGNGQTFKMGQDTWNDSGTDRRQWNASTGASTINFQTGNAASSSVAPTFFGATTDFTNTDLYAGNFGATGFTFRAGGTGGSGVIGTTYTMKIVDCISSDLPQLEFQAIYVYNKKLSDAEITDLSSYINTYYLTSLG